MKPYSAEFIGIAAAAATLYAAQVKTIVPLRVAAIVANFLAMSYSFLHGTYPTFLVNSVLLPLNVWRLREMLSLIREVEAATRGNLNVDWLLPYMRPKHFKAGDIILKRGEYATAAFYIVSGEVEIVEINESRRKGALIGEIGLFTPNGRRIMTVRCKTDVEAATIDYDRFKELCFQNPQFGFYLLHLIVARLLEGKELPPLAVSS